MVPRLHEEPPHRLDQRIGLGLGRQPTTPLCDSDSSLVLQKLRRNHRCPGKLGTNRPKNGSAPESRSAPNAAAKNSRGETDVLDTWMDSSITCAVHAGWPDRADWKHLFPASMHPSGTDIIRTWAYYLMVRHLALFDERPFNSVLINGMVLRCRWQKNEQVTQKLRSCTRSTQQVRRRRSPTVGCRRRSNRLRHPLPRSRRRIRQTLPG